jgi:cellulose synthase/poly-beta-1,6-N-acetylglucosamine synthase-like glycosyltransferase
MSFSDFDLHFAVLALEWIFVIYFLVAHGGHILLAVASISSLRRQIGSENVNMLPSPSAGYEIPLSIVVPVSDSDASEDVGRFVHSLFNLDYPEFEVIVAVDGASDDTLLQLRRLFEMEIFPEAFWRQVRSKAIRGVYRSARYPRLRVIDKEKGGTGDTINAGVNAARYPIVCITHPDCALQRTSLRRLVQDFIEDPNTVAAGTAPRVTSRGLISTGFLERPRFEGQLSSLVQATENLRKELCGRHGWATMNACLDVSDRFCVFRKSVFVDAGGCNRDSVNPLLELLGRIIRLRIAEHKPCRISYSPAPLVWHPAPSTPADIYRSVAHERHGLSDSLKSNSDLLWLNWTGALGRLAFPFLVVTEVAGPSIELLSLLFFLSAFALDLIPAQHLIAFAICSAGLGVVVSWLAIILDAIVFRTYAGAGSYIRLFIGAIFENVGFRQLKALCSAPRSPRNTPTQTATSQRA